MKPKLCVKCKKNVAVIFITRMENGVTLNEGYCIKCARSLGIPQIDDAVKHGAQVRLVVIAPLRLVHRVARVQAQARAQPIGEFGFAEAAFGQQQHLRVFLFAAGKQLGVVEG